MGQTPSVVQEQLDAAEKRQDDAAAKTEADMRNLVEILESKAQTFYMKLINSKGEDKTVPIKTVVDYKKHVSVKVSNKPSQELDSAVSELFGGNFLASLKAVCMLAINSVLTNSYAGEKTDEGYKLLLLNSAIVRVDYYVSSFNMFSSGLVDKSKIGLVFVGLVSVVDVTKVGLEALVYLVGAQVAQAMGFLESRKGLWQSRADQLKAITFANGADKWEEMQMWSADVDAALAPPSRADPPTEAEFTSFVNVLRSKIQTLLDSYNDLGEQVEKEQSKSLERMKAIFEEAADVVKTIHQSNRGVVAEMENNRE